MHYCSIIRSDAIQYRHRVFVLCFVLFFLLLSGRVRGLFASVFLLSLLVSLLFFPLSLALQP